MNLPDPQTLLDAADLGHSLPRPTDTLPTDPASLDTAWAVQARIGALRRARGETPAGYKIGFTNRTIWPLYGVKQPIWGPVWDSTVHHLSDPHITLSLARLAEPRLEPEIVIGLRESPPPQAHGRDETSLRQLLDCIDWVAHGIEIVQSVWPGWRFDAAQGIAAQALHASLYIGPRVPLATLGTHPAERLSALQLELTLDAKPIATGVGANVLDGPLQALGHLVAGLAERGERMPAGSVVTTGTLTDAQILAPGQHWQTRIIGAPLAGLSLATTA
jgi:2-oxo-3-hexenedioate decarboxylase